MRNTGYPSFSSQLTNFGNNNNEAQMMNSNDIQMMNSNEVQMLNSNQVQMLNSNDVSQNVYGSNSFFYDSQISNDQHLGSFAPLSAVEIPPSLNYLHLIPGSSSINTSIGTSNMGMEMGNEMLTADSNVMLTANSNANAMAMANPTANVMMAANANAMVSVNENAMAMANQALKDMMKEMNTARQPHFGFSQNRFSAQNTQTERKRTINIGNAPIMFKDNSTRIEESKKKKPVMSVEERRHPQYHVARTQAQKPVPAKKSQKIGDKIAILQKLVSPYGKTDTASVLKETSSQIKLLIDQIQMLTTAYFRPGPSPYNPQGAGDVKNDLRSRGLCLVPISLIQNFVNDDLPGHSFPLRRSTIPRKP